MTISLKIRSQLFFKTTTASTTESITSDADVEIVLIRLPLTRPLPGPRKRKSRAKKRLANQNGHGWSDDEHERFLRGLEIYPTGPWKTVATYIGTRTTRQVMTHAQKYRQKIARRQRGLQVPVRKRATPVLSPDSQTAAAHVKRAQEKIKIGVHQKPSLAVAPSLPHASSPSSAGQALSEFSMLHLFSTLALESLGTKPLVGSAYGFSDLAMTEDEFKLATDELYAEALWVDQFDNDDDRLAALVQDIDDPFVLMFQDPGSFSLDHSKSLDWTVPPLWTSTTSTLI